MPGLVRKEQDGLILYQSPQLLASFPVRHAFFTRITGVSGAEDCAGLNFRSKVDTPENVCKNFAIAAASIGGDLSGVVHTTQQHSDVIEHVKEGGFRPALGGEPVDALITAEPNLILTGFYADCQLVMLYDHVNRAIAVIHAGWRGAVNEIVRKTIDRMGQEFGTRARDLRAAVSPSICRRCFVTDDDVYELLSEVYGAKMSDFVFRENDKWHIDLKNITFSSLVALGVAPFSIDVAAECTQCGPDSLFWSHRRTGEKRGVHAGMLYLV